MYNFPGSPYGQAPGFGGFPPGQGAPPGMGAPPAMAAPGMGAPPSMIQQQGQPPHQMGAGFPPSFQAPAGMPNINFSAPVIRLGVPGAKPGEGRDGGRRAGLGSQLNAQQQANNMAILIPPTKDEIARTIFVGGITEGVGGDQGMERILISAGNLKKWIRGTDAEGKSCRFGFAEYEDADSLATAIEVLKDVKVPVKLQSMKKEGDTTEAEENGEKKSVEKSSLLVLADEGTLEYLEEQRAAKEDQDPMPAQLRENAAKANLAAILAELENPTAPIQQSNLSSIDVNGANGEINGNGEYLEIGTNIDEELADIPIEMRATVAKEIASFRERSNKRDLERLKREEEVEAMERARNAPKTNRLASPPLSAPTGPNGNIPSGPRDRSIVNAPSGPKGYQGVQVPRDYQKGVSFVNGLADISINREDEDAEASDEELERRRKAKKDAELEKLYLEQERRWLNREKSRAAAIEREKLRDKDDSDKRGLTKEAAAKRHQEWDDMVEAKRGSEDYYADRSSWIRNRTAFRQREANLDDIDRANEERERDREQPQQDQARGMAVIHSYQQVTEPDYGVATTAPREPARFKLSLGAATQRAQQVAASNKRTMADVEGLLEDEEETEVTTKRTLVPIKFEAAEASGLSEEERQQAARQLAAEIPSDKDGLWSWSVKWDYVNDEVVSERLKPFVEKKIVEYLGVQEQMLVEVVERHIKSKGKPQDLVEQLEGALDEEAEVLVKKLWRMLIFFSESEKRDIS